MTSWKLTALAPRPVIEAALLAHEDAWDWDPDIVISGSEIAEDKPDDWQLEAWLPRKPTKADKAAVLALFSGTPPKLAIEQLPKTDWLTASQQGLEPIRAGVFHVHTPEHPPLAAPGLRDFCIPASQAFGTGQHATTAGCLAMLTHMKRQGVVVKNCADIGTGTGLLAFAALHLWPRALATASDIDAVCVGVVQDNAVSNAVPLGARAGELTMLVADGMEHPLLAARGPYDLIIANILAGPLIGLAPDFARHMVPGGHLLLAGLLETQEAQVRRAARRAGLRLAARLVNGDWSILWLRKRAGRPGQAPDWAKRW
ncbi:50S ribosomal protein L11 methyltransferase [Novosphingobium sp.]|uniref:50S ribosomal protein L11 methyltransferase n=1 Tax=Novosphingobium sp. TaxID=1874826 RepID=UPI0022BDC0D9|nr:50S ribosomal protein L11 methyltransferase [Novosphingobium sp.]MCZ8017841.1 50S ribosomal protein L11 methyltransferase [Novosphingobium sp.]MCZ8033635.1 50S ribosomal protein L11 methyltransferase [Novosphingobium sp.]MCZ8050991.1 50S ribosomal protein L11 methyltransferase [Novosphingobium sp.]MCZ8059337.1 50S ribosomal protein L11 methyltransferase [Novosphingobium sp.]MCZ8231175.1 50S ribosomal protein L11 methyltransferase [Novosphingobium sp.]